MMKIVRVGTLLLATGIVTLAFAQSSTTEVLTDVKASEPWSKQPDTFRGISFGASEAEISTILGRVKCRDFKEWGEAGVPQRRCSVAERAKRLKIGESVMDETYILHDGRLVAIEIHQDSAIWTAPSPAPPFSAVRDAFIEKYGAPTREQTFRDKGVRQVTIDKYVGGRRSGKRIEYVPYERTRIKFSWEGDRLFVEMGGSNEGDDFFAVTLETQEWRRFLESAVATAKKKAAAADF